MRNICFFLVFVSSHSLKTTDIGFSQSAYFLRQLCIYFSIFELQTLIKTKTKSEPELNDLPADIYICEVNKMFVRMEMVIFVQMASRIFIAKSSLDGFLFPPKRCIFGKQIENNV